MIGGDRAARDTAAGRSLPSVSVGIFLRKFARLLPCLLATVSAGCINTRPNVPLGTTTAQLQAKFGPPLYKAPAEKGRQLWFYDMTFDEVKKSRRVAPLSVDATGEVDPGGLEFITEHTPETHPAPLVISPSGIVIEAPDAHVNPTR